MTNNLADVTRKQTTANRGKSFTNIEKTTKPPSAQLPWQRETAGKIVSLMEECCHGDHCLYMCSYLTYPYCHECARTRTSERASPADSPRTHTPTLLESKESAAASFAWVYAGATCMVEDCTRTASYRGYCDICFYKTCSISDCYIVSSPVPDENRNNSNHGGSNHGDGNTGNPDDGHRGDADKAHSDELASWKSFFCTDGGALATANVYNSGALLVADVEERFDLFVRARSTAARDDWMTAPPSGHLDARTRRNAATVLLLGDQSSPDEHKSPHRSTGRNQQSRHQSNDEIWWLDNATRAPLDERPVARNRSSGQTREHASERREPASRLTRADRSRLPLVADESNGCGGRCVGPGCWNVASVNGLCDGCYTTLERMLRRRRRRRKREVSQASGGGASGTLTPDREELATSACDAQDGLKFNWPRDGIRCRMIGCDFYADPELKMFCSKCFNLYLKGDVKCVAARPMDFIPTSRVSWQLTGLACPAHSPL
ncbi:PREDICTED: uncharacterized protein LOC106818136 [Priapulus caudatus]|uniref:Uncharacterized protein LOC106818136 n=1 Tax=Priapulus caudatus TaxID=37621 RepID=A0ABM1F1M3_PRICU|nr:PREDICTED: uncharacterized protein LOC106818136 [Priapulus caudatus]